MKNLLRLSLEVTAVEVVRNVVAVTAATTFVQLGNVPNDRRVRKGKHGSSEKLDPYEVNRMTDLPDVLLGNATRNFRKASDVVRGHRELHQSSRTFPPGKRRSNLWHCELLPKTMLGALRIVVVLVGMTVVAAKVGIVDHLAKAVLGKAGHGNLEVVTQAEKASAIPALVEIGVPVMAAVAVNRAARVKSVAAAGKRVAAVTVAPRGKVAVGVRAAVVVKVVVNDVRDDADQGMNQVIPENHGEQCWFASGEFCSLSRLRGLLSASCIRHSPVLLKIRRGIETGRGCTS